MKRIITIVSLFFLFCPVYAYALPQELVESLPEEVQSIWQDVRSDEDAPDLQQTLRGGIQILWSRAGEFFASEIRQSLHGIALILITVALCGMAESCFEASSNERVPNYVPLVGTLVITGIVAGDMQTMIGLGKETITEIHVLSETVLPALAAAVSATGGMVSASVRQVATVFFCNTLIALIKGLLLPLLSLLILLSAADTVLPDHSFGAICEAVRKGMTWLLTGSLLLFTGYLTISGAAAGTADNLTSQLMRSAISAAVPVVGGIISDATGSVLAGASVLKSTIGILGMLAVLTVCLSPFISLGIQYLLYKVASLFAGVLGKTLSGYLNALSNAFGLLLGMTGSCAMLLLISISSSLSVVIL